MTDTERFNLKAEALKKGDTAAAEEIFNYFAVPIHRFFMARIGNRETAQDLTQEVFVKVIRGIDNFDTDKGNFMAWIWQIAKNVAIDHYRAKKALYLEELPDEGANIPEDRSDVYDSARIREIMEVVKKLSKEEQELFELHFVADLSYSDLAATMDKSETALRVAVHRLRKKLKELL